MIEKNTKKFLKKLKFCPKTFIHIGRCFVVQLLAEIIIFLTVNSDLLLMWTEKPFAKNSANGYNLMV